MNVQKLKNFIFNHKNEGIVQFTIGTAVSLIATFLIFKSPAKESDQVPEDLKVNLNVMIPPNHVLYPFEASNFENIEPLLEAYNMVRVYDINTGKLIAKNIKVLRAPKDPSHLAFLIPVNIANKFSIYGIEFKVILQKYINKKPLLISETPKYRKNDLGAVTFGE